MNGAYFVEALFRLGYPEAPTLKPKEFDWMFDDTPDTQEFLRFFCSLGPQNVLSKEEEHLYTALVESGKPILTELELEKLEQTLTSRGMVLNEEDEGDEQVEGDDVYESLGDLQQELENLRAQKRLRHQRLLQLQSLRQRHGSNARALSEHTQGQEQGDGEVEPVAVAKALAKENVTTNVLLQELQGEVKKLQGLVCEEGDPVERQQEYLQMERRSRSRRSAALLSQLPLEAYLQEVQLAHQSIMGHYKVSLT